MKPEDPTASGRIPEKPMAPIDGTKPPPSKESAPAPTQRVAAKRVQPRKRKKPFVL